MICKLLLVDPGCAIRLSRRKVLISGLKFINMTLLDNDSRKVQQFDSSKQPQRENSQICPSPSRPNSKEVVTGPRTLRAIVCNFRKSVDSREFLNFFIFCPNNLCSTLISKVTSKLVTAFYFFLNRAKFEKR